MQLDSDVEAVAKIPLTENGKIIWFHLKLFKVKLSRSLTCDVILSFSH